MVRVVQPGFQPRTVANPALDSLCPHSFFNPNNEVWKSRTRDDINIAWTWYDTSTTCEYKKMTNKRGNNSVVLGIKFPHLQHEGHVLPGHNTGIIEHYLVARSATACGPNTWLFPFQKFPRLSKAQVLTKDRTIDWYRNIRSNP